MTSTAPHPPASAPHQPSFARRHPILTGFGVVAGLSLFAAYFPISAIVTAVIVGGHATGADRLALRCAERGASWIRGRVRGRAATPPPAPPAPAPPSPTRAVQREAAMLHRGVGSPPLPGRAQRQRLQRGRRAASVNAELER